MFSPSRGPGHWCISGHLRPELRSLRGLGTGPPKGWPGERSPDKSRKSYFTNANNSGLAPDFTFLSPGTVCLQTAQTEAGGERGELPQGHRELEQAFPWRNGVSKGQDNPLPPPRLPL